MKRVGIAATGVTAVAITAVAIFALLPGGSTGVHYDTRMDASDDAAPPHDWRSGYARAGTICYPQDATGITAKCFSADVLPYIGDATDIGWALELTQVNRLPYNVSSSCDGTPFDCSITASMDSTAVAPDGTLTASTLTVDATGTADATAFGYANSTLLDLRVYAKCPNGILDATHIGGEGHWTVDGTALGSGWQLLHTAHAAVTEVQAWKSDGSGGVRLRLSGNSCSFWHMTATEKASWHNSTIPTTDATGATVGTAAWTVDNSSGVYWAASGVTKTETLSEYSGTCWVYSGTTIRLSGAAGCEATWYALSLLWSY